MLNEFFYNNLKEVILYIDFQGRIKSLSHYWEELTGYLLKDSIGKSFRDYILKEDREVFDNMMGYVFLGQKQDRNIVFSHKNGIKKNINITIGTPDSNMKIVPIIMRDVTLEVNFETTIKEIEKRVDEIARTKASFFSMLSHEIRTPMNGIIGMLELLLRSQLSEEQTEFIETIKNSSESLLDIINGILEFSKIESGKIFVETRFFDLAKCIEESYRLFSNKASDKKIKMHYFIDNNVPINIESDSVILRQVLSNLISNALKFTNKGEIFTSVKVKSQKGEVLELIFCVRDTGIGIKKEDMSKLFQPFSQDNFLTSKKYGGTGLGLIICNRLVNLMEGSMWVESEENEGSRFYFTIKAKIKANFSVSFINKSIPELKNKYIVLIGENQITPDFDLEGQLKQWGLKLISVKDEADFLELLEKKQKLDVCIINKDNIEEIFFWGDYIRKVGSKDYLPTALISSERITENEDLNKIFNFILEKPIRKIDLLSNVIDLVSKTSNKIETQKKQITHEKMGLDYPLKILVTEDILINQKLMNYILSDFGYSADIVSNGLEVIEALNKSSYDIIFIDVEIPDKDSLNTIQNIIYLFSKKPVIIALTANAIEGTKEKYLSLGVDDYISKPVKPEDILIKLEYWARIIYEQKKLIFSEYTYDSLKEELDKIPFFDSSILKDMSVNIDENEKEALLMNLNVYGEFIFSKMKDLQEAVNKNEIQKIAFLSHTIKGSCANIGFKKLNKLAEIIETDAKSEEIKDISKYLENLNDLEKEFVSFFDTYKKNIV